MHVDQTGRDGGAKKVKEEYEPLDDPKHNDSDSEDGRGCSGCYQPLLNLKTNPELEAADVPRDLMRRGQMELITGAASPPTPASPPSLPRVTFKPLAFFAVTGTVSIP